MEGPGDRAVAYLKARVERIERRVEEITKGSLDGIVDSDDRINVLESYGREVEMYQYMLDAILLKARIHTLN